MCARVLNCPTQRARSEIFEIRAQTITSGGVKNSGGKMQKIEEGAVRALKKVVSKKPKRK